MLKHHHKNRPSSTIHLASAGEDVRLWQMPDLSQHSVKNGANANVVHCACSPSGQLVAYSHEESGINVASILDETLPIIEIPTACEQSSVSFNGNSRYIISGGADCVINIWDIKSRTSKRTYKDHKDPITYCTFNYNDNVIASASDHGEILLTNVQSGLSSDPLYGADDTQAVRCLGYSYFSRSLMASISDSGSLCLWDTKEKKLLKKFTDHKAPGTALSFSPLNDMLLCSTGLDKRLIFYDVSGKKTVKTINAEGPITCCDFLNDGCTVAAGSASGHVFLFDLRQGSTPVKVISAHKTSVRSVSFQKVPKESKSPKKPVDESKASSTSEQNGASNETTNTGSNERDMFDVPPSVSSTPVTPIMKRSLEVNKQEVAPMSRENSSSSIIKEKLPPPVPTTERPPYPESVTARVNPVKRTDNTANSMMGARENSTMALNRLISLNQTPEQAQQTISAIPPKAAKIIGEEIFSPIATDSERSTTLPRKLKASKQKSLGKNYKIDRNDDRGEDEPERPFYGRSKSGLSRLSMLAKSMEDINSTKIKPDKKDKEKDKELDDFDGKKGGGPLKFKSPFKKNKKNAYNKHSDESETSSIDSLNLEDKLNVRGKKDRLSDRSNDSGGGNKTELPRKISNGPGGYIPANRQIDTNQLMTDIQLSLANQGNDVNSITPSTSMQSGEFVHIQKPNSAAGSVGSGGEVFQYDAHVSEQRPPQIQIDFIQKLIDEAMEENRVIIHSDMVNLQIEMLRQMEIQKEQIREMLQQNSINGSLLKEVERLRAENERLKTKY